MTEHRWQELGAHTGTWGHPVAVCHPPLWLFVTHLCAHLSAMVVPLCHPPRAPLSPSLCPFVTLPPLLQGTKGERGLPGTAGGKGEKGDRVSVPVPSVPVPGLSPSAGRLLHGAAPVPPNPPTLIPEPPLPSPQGMDCVRTHPGSPMQVRPPQTLPKSPLPISASPLTSSSSSQCAEGPRGEKGQRGQVVSDTQLWGQGVGTLWWSPCPGLAMEGPALWVQLHVGMKGAGGAHLGTCRSPPGHPLCFSCAGTPGPSWHRGAEGESTPPVGLGMAAGTPGMVAELPGPASSNLTSLGDTVDDTCLSCRARRVTRVTGDCRASRGALGVM